MMAGDDIVAGTRSALIVASSGYADAGLRQLRAPAVDARALAAVLHDPGIGGFEVRTLLDEPAHEVNLSVEEFFADRRPDDLLLAHFSCHGVKDEDGELYFAMANTLLRRLGATAVAAEFVNRRMSRSRSRRVVLLLDCCYAGAFERGMTARAGEGMGIESQFGGRGRAVITASSAMEYAFEGDQLADTRELAPSVFTSALVEGLETGDADRDQDGLVALDELYDYIYDRVRAVTPNQTPGKWTFGIQGELVIARRARPVTTPVPLPPELQEAIDSPLAAIRAAAVQELARLLRGTHAGRALAAQLALERLTEDDSRTVAAAATSALRPQAQPPAPPRLELPTTLIDFGRLTRHTPSPERRIRLSNAGGGRLNARAVTQAGWLRLRQEGDELVLALDTTAEGEHKGTVTVDSDGGSATIGVQASVGPTPQPAVKAATPHPEAAAAGHAQSGMRQDSLSSASPPPAVTAPSAAPAPAHEAPGSRVRRILPLRAPRRRAALLIALGVVVVTAGTITAVLTTQTGQTSSTSGAGNTISSVAFNRDGTILASASFDHTVRLWNTVTHKQIGQPLEGQTNQLFTVAFSPDGKVVAAGGYDKTVQLWDTARHDRIATFDGQSGRVNSVAFSPDGKYLASGDDDGTVLVRDLATRGIVLYVHAGSGHVFTVAFSPDSKILATGGQDGTVRLWNLRTERQIGQPIYGPGEAVNSVAFSPDGRLLASDSQDGKIELWTTTTRGSAAILNCQAPVLGVAFSHDGKVIACGTEASQVLLWTTASYQQKGPPLDTCVGWVDSVAFSPVDDIFATGCSDVRLWNPDSEQQIGKSM